MNFPLIKSIFYIYSRIALSFALNNIFFSGNENGTVKQNNQSYFKDFFTLINQAIKLCDLKMDLIKC